MKNLYTLLTLIAVSACNAYNTFDAFFERMKNMEQHMEKMHNKFLDYAKSIEFSKKDNDANVTLIFKTNGIDKQNVIVTAEKGEIFAEVPTKNGQSKIHIGTNEHGKKFVEIMSKQDVIHEIKDATGKVLSSYSETVKQSETHSLPTNIDVLQVSPEVSDDSITLVIPKEESKKIPVTVV